MAERNRIVLDGALPGGEVWSTSLQFGGTTGGTVINDQSDLLAWAQAAGNTISTAWTGYTAIRTGLSSGGSLARITAQYFGPSNELAAQAQWVLIAPLTGLTAPNKPTTSAVCVSLRTGFPGASRRGRVYLPALANALGADCRYSSSAALQFASEWRDLAEGIADDTPGLSSSIYCVYSPTLDTLTPITQIQVGRVPDTQRRRRDALQEEYSSTAYPG